MDEKYQVQLLKESPLFDADWYRSQHSDVVGIKLTPEQHYLRYGWRMGRSPSALFCGVSYLEKYPDVVQSNENPLVHYLRFGRREGREIKSVKQIRNNLKKDIGLDLGKLISPNSEEAQFELNIPLINQLKETQYLLEKYVRRCHELEYQIMDENL
ncbi:hypothetical protein ACJJID_01610 [Microbulbifer sp. CnH-101-G]|uniref:hypothetical protein n=1 Tax=Microbulbifer sp. CnH-101-G TaxID=3243393 RepID=UPI004039CF5A